MESQLERELRFHLEQHTTELISRGHSPDEARRQARLAIGGPEQVKEQCRDARGTRWLEDLAQDFRYTLRTLGRQRGFAAVALLTLALGTGVTTIMFTVVNGVLIKPLPFPQPDRLLSLQEQTNWSNQYGNIWAFAYPNFLDIQRQSHALAAVAAWRFSVGTISDKEQAEYASGRQVSAGFFSVLGTPPAQGRDFLPEDDRAGAQPVVILGHSFSQRFQGETRLAVGRTITMDGKSFTVVGIAPAGLRFDGEEPDVFTPLGQDTSPSMQNRSRHPGLGVLARLQPGATIPQAQTELALIARQLETQYPDSNKGRTFIA